MATTTILPRDLPPASVVANSAALIIDTGVNVQKASPRQIVDAGRPIATEAQAVAGLDNETIMTPLRVKQAIEQLAPSGGGASEYIFSFFMSFEADASEVVCAHVAGVTFSIPGNFASAIQAQSPTPPTADLTLTVAKNGSDIGSITINDDGTFAAATTGGAAVDFAAGDLITFTAPMTPVSGDILTSITILGVR